MATTYKYNAEGNGKKVFIATPCFSGAPSAPYVFSLLKTLDLDCQVSWCLLTGNCHVDDARNHLVRDFLESDCEYLFFIDADVGWQKEDFKRLVEAKYDVVAGVYPKKNDVTEYPVVFFQGEIQANDGFIKVEKVPSGFLRLKRNVIQNLYDIEKRSYNSVKDVGRLAQKIIFERTYVDNKRISGDYFFCDKWRAIGGEIYIDPEMRFVHEGSKEWSGKLAHYLRKTNGLLNDYIGQIVYKLWQKEYDEKDFFELYEAHGNSWSAPPDLMASLAVLLEETRGNVLELGSGITTVICGAIAERTGSTVTTVEHDPEWIKKTAELLNNNNIRINLQLCKIKDGWYDFEPDKNYDLVLIDGPPRDIGRNGVNKIQKFFNKGCVIIADDFGPNLGIELDGVKFKQYGRFAIGVKK